MNHMSPLNEKIFLKSLFKEAINAADPFTLLKNNVPDDPKGRTLIVGCGKAAASMAAAFETYWKGKSLSGLVVTMYGHKVPTKNVEVIEAGHPVPDLVGLNSAKRIYSLANDLRADDLMIFLVSGGGSALMPLPIDGISLADKQSINISLLKSGANIYEINSVRKHLSKIKGGQLALAAYPAKVITLAISDIPGDDPTVLASGPTVADTTTFNDAIKIIDKYQISLPESVGDYLRNGDNETPKPDDSRLKCNEFHLIGTPQKSLEAAASLSSKNKINPFILGSAIEGESREVAVVHAGIAKQVRLFGQPLPSPCLLLSGGETTVKVVGRGRGGRNAEFLLSLAIQLENLQGIWGIAADTDGLDGAEDNAGAILTPETIRRSYCLNLDAKLMLRDNDAYSFFSMLNDLVITGPTLTNVNDFRAILIKDDK